MYDFIHNFFILTIKFFTLFYYNKIIYCMLKNYSAINNLYILLYINFFNGLRIDWEYIEKQKKTGGVSKIFKKDVLKNGGWEGV